MKGNSRTSGSGGSRQAVRLGLGLAWVWLSGAAFTAADRGVNAVAGEDVFCDSSGQASVWLAYSDPVGGEGARRLQDVVAAATVPTVGSLRALLVLVVFSDEPAQALSVEQSRVLAEQAEDFFARASHGALSLTVTVSPAVPLGRAADYRSGQEGQLRADAHAALRAQGVDPMAHDLDVILAPHPAYRSQAYVGRRGAWVSARAQDRPESVLGTLLHELGHNLGLHHAGGWHTADGSVLGTGSAVEYGNPFDTMGTHYESPSSSLFGAFKGFNAFAQRRLGWLPEANLITVIRAGSYRLLPSDAPRFSAGGFHALRLELPGAPVYWAEFRASRPALLVQAHLPGTPRDEPVLLNTRPDSHGGFYDAGVEPGRSFLDPEAGWRIVPRAVPGWPDELEVEVRRVHHGFHEADVGLGEDERIVEAADATFGRAVRLTGPGDYLPVPVEVAEAGEYLLWLRAKATPGELSVRVFPAGGENLEGSLAVAAAWSWARLDAAADGSTGTRLPLVVPLPAGPSVLYLEAGREAWFDVLLLTNDDTPDTPPYLALPAEVRLRPGGPTVEIRIGVADVEAAFVGQPRLALRVEHSRLVTVIPPDGAAAGEFFSGSGADRALRLRAGPGTLGRTTLHVRAVDGQGHGVSRVLQVVVAGEAQDLVDETPAGVTVRLPTGVFTERLDLRTEVILEGAGPDTVLDAGGIGTAIQVAAGARVTLRDLTVRNGVHGLRNAGELTLERVTVTGHSGMGIENQGVLFLRDSTVSHNRSSGAGGGLRNWATGRAIVENSTFHANQARDGHGGGIANEGVLHLRQSTLSGNRTLPRDIDDTTSMGGRGGGLYNSGQATVVASTLTENRSSAAGGGLLNQGSGTLTLHGSIVAGNASDIGLGPDAWGEVQSEGFNLFGSPAGLLLKGVTAGNRFGLAAGLGPLADHGGPTLTHVPLPGSPVVDAGPELGLLHDQRGLRRGADGGGAPGTGRRPDIGATEFTDRPVVRVAAAAELDAQSHFAALSLALPADAAGELAFTLRYPAALVRPVEGRLDADAAGAALELTPDPEQGGRLGVRIRLAAAPAARPEGRLLLTLSFEAIRKLRDPALLRFEFGDEAEPRAAADADGTPLPVLFPVCVQAVAAAPPALTLRREANGRLAVWLHALPGLSGWLEASADFETWEVAGELAAGEPFLFEASSAPGRFFRWSR